ncbi:hypothetical protein D9M71_657640 [compost metagenome]
MTLKVWLFCALISVGALVGILLFELQTEALWKAAVGRAIYVFFGSAVTAFYFTRPGFLAKLTN